MISYANAHDEVKRGFEKLGKGNPATQMHLTGLRNEGIGIMSDGMNMQFLNPLGGGLVSVVPNYAGPIYQRGDETTVSGQRKTASFATQSGLKQHPGLIALCSHTGAGVRIDGGGGRADTILVSTANGQNGIVITEGSVCIFSGAAYF